MDWRIHPFSRYLGRKHGSIELYRVDYAIRGSDPEGSANFRRKTKKEAENEGSVDECYEVLICL
jgi:hypothetical protein